MRHYKEPHLQKHIVRLILMIPIYTIDSYLSLIFRDISFYLDIGRDCYEAYVLWTFFKLLVELAGGEESLIQKLEQIPQIRYTIPMCCFHIKPGRTFLHRCKQMILQFVVWKPILAVTSFVTQMIGVYKDGDFSPTAAYLYITIVDNVSITISLYFLVLFYEATKDILKPFKPISKFLCIKAVIFFAFWQSVVIDAMVYFDLVFQSVEGWTVDEISTATQNALICFEMFPIAIAFAMTFGYQSFRDRNIEHLMIDEGPTEMFRNFAEIVNVRDMLDDTRVALQKTPRKTVEAGTYIELSEQDKIQRVIKHGWLMKRGEDLAKNWQKRYFVFISEPLGLLYYASNPFEISDVKPRGFIKFAEVTEVSVKTKKRFQIVTQIRKWHLKCSSTEERDSWITTLNNFVMQAINLNENGDEHASGKH